MALNQDSFKIQTENINHNKQDIISDRELKDFDLEAGKIINNNQSGSKQVNMHTTKVNHP